MDIWQGPMYEMHFKYAIIMNSVFITMMFGVALPKLFPICVVTLGILYISEKF